MKIIWLSRKTKQILPMSAFLVFVFSLILISIPLNEALAIAGPNYPNPLTVNSFTGLLSNFLASVQGIVGWLAVIMIVIGGVVYITSGGHSSQVSLAKTIITFALVGFAIAVAAPSLLREIRDIAAGGVGGGPGLISTATPVATIIENIMNFALTIIGVLATIGFVVSAIMYISAGGDTSRAETAKRMMFYSILAVTIAGASLIILKQVIALLS
ncbi:MAG: hypothetical protein U9O20_01445 [Patescibacteria group bacterium]|nr:hypothetical protein [Patescibacteria group bacterium]